MPDRRVAQEFFVLVPGRIRRGVQETSEIWGPFRYGIRKSETPRVVAERFAASREGAKVLGPFDPKKDPRKGRAMDEKMNSSANTPEAVEHMLKELERPKGMLSRWELDFLHSVKDQFDRRGSLSDRQFTVLERVYAERTA